MKTVVIGGNSRNIGKTSLACSLIEATRKREWTAVKITQFGHGICSSSGEPCGCSIEDPECPFEISVETGEKADSDTARMLTAGARESLWVRVAMGRLGSAMPAIRQQIKDRGHVLFESNSIVDFVDPDVFLAVLHFDVADFKASAARLHERADAYVLPVAKNLSPPWPGFDTGLLSRGRTFSVAPPKYCSPDVVEFLNAALRE